MKMTFRVTYADDPDKEHFLLARIVDFVALEEQFDEGFDGALQNLPISRMTWLAWRAGNRAGRIHADYQAWLDTVDDLEPLTDDEAGEDGEQGEAKAG